MLNKEEFKEQLDNYLKHKKEYDLKYAEMDENRKNIGDKLLDEEKRYEEMVQLQK